jgi:DNA-binding MarR family transcriptional regulator
MSTIFHEGRKILRLSLNNNHNLAEIADLLHFRISGSKYKDGLGQFFLLPNIEHLSETTGFGLTVCKKHLKELEKNGFIRRVKLRCYDNAVRTKIYITEKFKNIMSTIANLKCRGLLKNTTLNDNAIKDNKQSHINVGISVKLSTKQSNATITSDYPDQTHSDESEKTHSDESFIKEETIKEHNIVKQVIDFKKYSNKTKQSNLIDITNTPNFTTDTKIKPEITDNQINAISEAAEEYKIDPCELFDSVMESLDRAGGLFDNYNQLLATSINKQLASQLDQQTKENVRGECKYDIDFNSTELADDDRLEELDKSQQYAIEHNLKYLQKFKGKQFDMSEMKQWVSHSLICGYKGLGFKKAIRCIVKSIKDDKYTRPWSLHAKY